MSPPREWGLPNLIFRSPLEIVDIASLALEFLLILVDLAILIVSLVLAALQLVADQRSGAQT